MSGHSKWSTIKRKKGLQDAKKGKIFTKLSQMITIAAQEGGGDASSNFALRLAVEKAKGMNMPKDNIDRAINKAIGKDSEKNRLEEITYEGSGQNGVAIIVDTATDNKNRTASEVRRIFESHGGSLGANGSVSWQFNEKGLVRLRCAKLVKSEKFGESDKEELIDKEDVVLSLFDLTGVEDVLEVKNEDSDLADCAEVGAYCQKADLSSIRDEIAQKGYIIVAAEIIKIPQTLLKIDEDARENARKIVEELEDNDDVQNVWVNINLD